VTWGSDFVQTDDARRQWTSRVQMPLSLHETLKGTPAREGVRYTPVWSQGMIGWDQAALR